MHWVLQEKIEPSPSTTVCIQKKTLKVVYLSLWCLVTPFEPGKFMQKCLKVLLSSNFCIQCYISFDSSICKRRIWLNTGKSIYNSGEAGLLSPLSR